MCAARAVLAACVVLLTACWSETDAYLDDGPPPERAPEGTVVLPELLSLTPENGHWVDATCSRRNPDQACIVVAEQAVNYTAPQNCGPPGNVRTCVRVLTAAEMERDKAFDALVAGIAQQYTQRLLKRDWTQLHYADGTSGAGFPVLRKRVDGQFRCVLLYGSMRQHPALSGRALGVVEISDNSDEAYCAAGVLPGYNFGAF